MKNNEYRQLQKRLVFTFLFLTVIILGAIFAFVIVTEHYANIYSAQGLLSDSDFYWFYLKHSYQINTTLFVVGLTLLLYIFLSLYFHNMNVLLKTMQGKNPKTPFNFRIYPQFSSAKGKVEEMLRKRNETKELSIQEKEHKNELLMYLAHDLKTPLTSMIGYINHILDHHVEEEQMDNSIKIAYDKAQRLDDLIDEFAEILRFDDKVSQLDLTKIDVDTMLQQQLAGFYPLMEKRGITLQVEVPKDFYVVGDYDKLLRVFDNLMRNAINYSNEDSIIEISGEQRDAQICLIYQNEAEAIDEESVKHLFDKFYRASTARTTTSGGAGLGLAIAKEIIELHHGSIQASTNGHRVIFTILLPITQGVFL